ncbi:MAG: class I SAM-dependent methyltransferase [Desulfobacteraceae bacterium]|nr:class I SAM-dependent methyltransferase [Desulfobacteraceae bacterium]
MSSVISGKDKFILNKFIQILKKEELPIEVIDTTGKKYGAGHNKIEFKLQIKDNRFFKSLVSPDAFSLGEAFVKGYFDIYGNFIDLYDVACNKLLNTDRRIPFLKFFKDFFSPAKKREKENIEYHYDIPSTFYKLFLGKTLGYTCGYYTDEKTSMDQAQYIKMDIICKKLRLQKDENLLDIGCGWGNFLIYAAKNYGVNTTGITLSEEQKKYAEQWIKKEGLENRCKVKIFNYRDLGDKLYDKISCIGMSEHVGKKNMPGFFRTAYRSLVPDGLFLQHTITTNEKRKRGYENTFLDKYMFPGGELSLNHKLIDQAFDSGFELMSSENFRVHYIKTLKDWIDNMELKKDDILETVSEFVYRIYYIFFIGSLISFKNQEISLFQNLFYKKKENNNKIEYFSTPYAS